VVGRVVGWHRWNFGKHVEVMVFWSQSASDIGSFIDKHSHTLLIDWPKLFRPKKETFVESVEVWDTYLFLRTHSAASSLSNGIIVYISEMYPKTA
jgi:hypothetical protein